MSGGCLIKIKNSANNQPISTNVCGFNDSAESNLLVFNQNPTQEQAKQRYGPVLVLENNLK